MKVREISRRRAHRRVAVLAILDDPRLAMGRPQLAGCIEKLAPQVWEAVVWRFHRGNRLYELTDRKIRFRPPKNGDGRRGVVGRISLSYRLNNEERECRRRFTVRRLSLRRQLSVLIGTV